MKWIERVSPKNRGAGTPPVPAILFVVGLVAVVLLFVTLRQIKSAEARRLRLLSSFSDRVELTVQDLTDRFVTTVTTPELRESAAFYLEQVPHLELLQPPEQVARGQANAAGSSVGDRGASEGIDSLPDLSLRANGSRVYLTYRERRRDDTGSQGSQAGPETLSPLYESVARIDLRALLEPVIIPDVFDSIVVTDDHGTVLFQVGEPELKATSVQALFERPANRRAAKDDAADGVSSSAAPTFQEVRQTTGMVKRNIGGNEYRLFVQPISLELRALEGREAPAPTHWSVCGIVSSDRLLSSGVTTSPVLLFLLVALFPAGLVSWPFLKLWLISPRQRFTRLDAAFLLFAAVLGLGLATLLVLDLLFLWTVSRTVDQELAQLSTALEHSFREELFHGYLELDHMKDDEGLISKVASLDLDSIAKSAADSAPGASRSTDIEELLAETIPATVDVTRLCAYPWLRSVFWADPEGRQRAKLPLYEESILENRVGDRGYFECALRTARGKVAPRGVTDALDPAPLRDSFAGKFTLQSPHWPPAARDEQPCLALPDSWPDRITFCLEPLLDRTTGQDRMVLSMARDDREELPVAALVARPLSLTYPVLAPGFGFALIEPGGRVLSHSDPRRNLTESFLKASDEDSVLSSIIDARRAGWLDLVYQGRRRRAFVRPLDGLPWHLITFRSTRELRLRNFELIYDFLNPLVVYTVVVNLAFALAVAFAPGRWLRHLWPSWRYLALYRKIVLGGLPLIALFAVILAFGGRRAVFLASFGLPFLALVLIAAGLALERRKRRARERERLERHDDGGADPAEDRNERDGATPGGKGSLVRWLPGIGLGAALGLSVAAVLHAWSQKSAVLEVSFLALLVCLWSARFWRRRSNFRGRQRRVAYTFALKVLLLVLGVLPALGFFHLASSRQLQFLRQDAQLGLASGIEARRLVLLGGRGPVEGLYEHYRPVLEAMEGRYLASFETEVLAQEAEGTGSVESACDPRLWVYDRSDAECLSIVDRLLSARLVPLNDLTAEPTGTDLSRFERPTGSWSLKGDGRLVAALPEEWGTGASVRLATTLPDPGNLGKLGTGQLVLLALLLVALVGAPSLLARFVAENVLLISLVRGSRREPVKGILDNIQRHFAKGQKRFLLITENPELAAKRHAPEGFEVVPYGELEADAEEPNREEGSATESHPDHAAASSGSGEVPSEDDGKGDASEADVRSGYLIVGFSADPEPEVAKRRIRELDRMCSDPDVPLVLLVESYPRLPADPRRSSDEGEDRNGERGDEEQETEAADAPEAAVLASDEWRLFLAKFTVRYGEISPLRKTPIRRYLAKRIVEFREGQRTTLFDEIADPQVRHEERLLELLLDESRHGWRLQQCAWEVLSDAERREGGLGLVTANQLVSRIGTLAEPYYESLWRDLDADEQVVLVQLAEEGVVNPKSQASLLRLMDRELVVRDPSLRLMNRSFTRFVLRQSRRLDARRKEAEEGASPWSVLKWLLPLPLLLLAGFLFITQREAVTNLVAILLAAASLAPMFFNLSGQLQQLGGRGAGKSRR